MHFGKIKLLARTRLQRSFSAFGIWFDNISLAEEIVNTDIIVIGQLNKKLIPSEVEFPSRQSYIYAGNSYYINLQVSNA